MNYNKREYKSDGWHTLPAPQRVSLLERIIRSVRALLR